MAKIKINEAAVNPKEERTMKETGAFSRLARWLICIGIGLALFAGGCATEYAAKSGVTGSPCTPAGTWRGGSSYDTAGDPYDDLGVRYLLTMVPIGRNRFTALWEGSYVTPPGYTRMTQYSGELVKDGDGTYDCIGMAYFSSSSTFPPDSLPQVWVIHGKMEVVDCNTVRFTWDTFNVYDWHSQPFVDDPLLQPAATPIVEVYKRFQMPGD
jgi:hypothetical protein